MTAIFQALRGVLFFVLIFGLLIIVNVFQTASLILLPFSRKAFRSFNRFCANSWWGLCVICAEKVYGTRLILSGDTLPPRENAIVIVNHQDMSDIFLVMMLALTKERLGDLKFFVKDVLKYVPGVGWGMLFLDCIFVKRNWEADKDKISEVFSKFQAEKIPIWLVSYVEGTRFSKAKMLRSQGYANEHSLPILSHVLLPRTKGFVASVQGLHGHVTAIYDLTIAHAGGVPSLWDIITGRVREFHMRIKRYEIDTLPEDPGALTAWLMERFVEKDAWLSEHKG